MNTKLTLVFIFGAWIPSFFTMDFEYPLATTVACLTLLLLHRIDFIKRFM